MPKDWEGEPLTHLWSRRALSDCSHGSLGRPLWITSRSTTALYIKSTYTV